MKNYTVLYERVLLRLLDQTNKTKGGLYLPDVAMDGSPWRYAEVVAVGHGRICNDGTLAPLTVKPGDYVLFFRNAQSGRQVAVPVGNEELLIAVEADIGLVLDKSELRRGTGLVGIDGSEVTTGGIPSDIVRVESRDEQGRRVIQFVNAEPQYAVPGLIHEPKE